MSDAECQSLRQRLAEHAQLSEVVRKAVATQAGAATAPTGRAEVIRARLEQIPKDRPALDLERE